MFLVAKSRAPILSKAGWSEAAANTVRVVWGVLGAEPDGLPPHAASSPAISMTRKRSGTWKLNSDVGRLDHRDRRHSRLELQLLDRLACEQRDQPMRPGLDLDLRSD